MTLADRLRGPDFIKLPFNDEEDAIDPDVHYFIESLHVSVCLGDICGYNHLFSILADDHNEVSIETMMDCFHLIEEYRFYRDYQIPLNENLLDQYALGSIILDDMVKFLDNLDRLQDPIILRHIGESFVSSLKSLLDISDDFIADRRKLVGAFFETVKSLSDELKKWRAYAIERQTQEARPGRKGDPLKFSFVTWCVEVFERATGQNASGYVDGRFGEFAEAAYRLASGRENASVEREVKRVGAALRAASGRNRPKKSAKRP